MQMLACEWIHVTCSLSIGNGSQFLALSVSIILMALMGMFNVHRWDYSPPFMVCFHCTTIYIPPFHPPSYLLPSRHHSMNSAAILLYAFTSCVSGFVSANLFRKLGGHNWAWNVILTASLFAVPFFFVWSLVNSVAWYYNSTQALPFTTIILILFIWLIGESHHVTVVA